MIAKPIITRLSIDSKLTRPASIANRIALVVLAAALCLTSHDRVVADAWVERMVQNKEYDFGTVASAADAVYRFPIKNIYKHDIELLSVRSSCACTTTLLDDSLLQPGEVGYVVATFNTRMNAGPKSATLTLEAAWTDNALRRIGEAKLQIRGIVKSSLTIDPEAISFGTVTQGMAHERKVTVSTEGRQHWRLDSVQRSSDSLEVEFCEACRTSERVAYDMLVRLNQWTPPGYVQEHLLLLTNDQIRPRIPLYVSGRVVPVVTVAPESIFFGEVQAGRHITKKIIVRGSKPFSIVSVGSDNEDLQFKFDRTISMRHIVEILFHAERDTDELNETVSITTDASATPTLIVHGTVVTP
jgi:hypothetical protein